MTKLKIALAAVAVILAALWFSGRLDYVLYPVGLNHGQCARNGFGATFCDGDLTAYERRIQGVQNQMNAAQQRIQQLQQTATQQECQADPQLPMCSSP